MKGSIKYIDYDTCDDPVTRRVLEAAARQREIERPTSPPMPGYEAGYLDAWVKAAEEAARWCPSG